MFVVVSPQRDIIKCPPDPLPQPADTCIQTGRFHSRPVCSSTAAGAGHLERWNRNIKSSGRWGLSPPPPLRFTSCSRDLNQQTPLNPSACRNLRVLVRWDHMARWLITAAYCVCVLQSCRFVAAEKNPKQNHHHISHVLRGVEKETQVILARESWGQLSVSVRFTLMMNL